MRPIKDEWARGNEIIATAQKIRNIDNDLRPSSTFALSTGRVIGATHLPPRTYGGSLGYPY